MEELKGYSGESAINIWCSLNMDFPQSPFDNIGIVGLDPSSFKLPRLLFVGYSLNEGDKQKQNKTKTD